MKRFMVRTSIVFAILFALLPFAYAAQAQDAPADIVDTAVAAGDFTTLVAAVQAAGLVDTLKGEGPFTVFAPTDAAFAALPAGTVDALLADPAGDLTQILLYHVIAGNVMAADLSDGLQANTVQGAPLTFALSDSGATVNGDNNVTTDIATSNGVIHVIDAVLLPPAAEEEEMEPEVLPVTGVSLSSGSTLIALLVGAVVLGAATVASRRRLI